MLRTFNCRGNKGKNAKGKGKKGKKESYDLIVNIDLQAWKLTSEQVDLFILNKKFPFFTFVKIGLIPSTRSPKLK